MVDYTKTIAETNKFIVLDKYKKDWKIAENFPDVEIVSPLASPFMGKVLNDSI